MTEERLHVYLSRAGIASRRRAEAYIKEGRVTVNGEVVTVLGRRITPGVDQVSFDGEPIEARQPKTTLMLHKPVKVVTTLSDPEGRETVADLIGDEPYRFLPVGRLDYHTEGLLLMTTDGELSHRLLHPRYHVPKVYHVKVRGRPGRGALGRLQDGVDLEDGRTQPAIVDLLETHDRYSWLEIVVSEGRNRLVRRMCEAIGYPAQRVIRSELATLPLGDLKPGEYRYLTPAELGVLYKVASLPIPKGKPQRVLEVGEAILGERRRGRGRLPGDPHGKHAWSVDVDAKREGGRAGGGEDRGGRRRGQARDDEGSSLRSDGGGRRGGQTRDGEGNSLRSDGGGRRGEGNSFRSGRGSERGEGNSFRSGGGGRRGGQTRDGEGNSFRSGGGARRGGQTRDGEGSSFQSGRTGLRGGHRRDGEGSSFRSGRGSERGEGNSSRSDRGARRGGQTRDGERSSFRSDRGGSRGEGNSFRSGSRSEGNEDRRPSWRSEAKSHPSERNAFSTRDREASSSQSDRRSDRRPLPRSKPRFERSSGRPSTRPSRSPKPRR